MMMMMMVRRMMMMMMQARAKAERQRSDLVREMESLGDRLGH